MHRPALAEGRRLELVARGVAVEPKPCASAAAFEPVEMRVEVGDPVFGIEPHDLFKVVIVPPLRHSFAAQSGDAQAPRLRSRARASYTRRA